MFKQSIGTHGRAARIASGFNKGWAVILDVPKRSSRLTDYPAISSLLSSEFDRRWHAFWQDDLTGVPG
jgi:hypothetical protein